MEASKLLSQLVVLSIMTFVMSQSNDYFLTKEKSEYFAKVLVDRYGSQDQMRHSHLDGLMHTIKENNCPKTGGHGHGSSHESGAVTKYESCFTGNDVDINCVFKTHLNSSDIYRVNNISTSAAIDWMQFRNLAVSVLFELQKNVSSEGGEDEGSGRPSSAEVWGYGFLAVTIINICACLGALFYPLRKTSLYNLILTFMVALGVGTLVASGVLVLIPEAFGLMLEGSPFADTYLAYAMVVLAGMYMFFLLERFLKFLRSFRRKRKMASKNLDNKTVTIIPTVTGMEAQKNQSQANGDAVVTPGEEKGIKPVAWMVVFGDAVHNFVDGLAIGSAFSRRILFGVSVSLAIVCEELPHELGDFAILLNSGMSIKRALLCNFLSACTCYIGLAIGILIGELEEGGQWIFAIAGGMFLYISLVNMLPELNDRAEEEAEETGKSWPSFLIHNLGLLSGVFIIYILVRFGDNIDIETASV